MSLDRAIMLPYEFAKMEDSPLVDGTGIEIAEVLRSPTKNSVKVSQEFGESARKETIEKC